MPPINLTEGAIAMLSSGETQGNIKPVLQVTDIRSKRERFLILLSDGSFTQQGILATQRNDLVQTGKLQKGSIVMLTQFVCNTITNRMIIIIVDLDVILEKCDTIGEPKQYPTETDWNIPSMAVSTPQVQSMNQPIAGNGAQSYGSGLSIGVVSSNSPPDSLMSKNETGTRKRTLQMKDESVEDTISTDLDFPQARKLKTCFDNKGERKRTPVVYISREMGLARTDVRKTIKQIEDEELGLFDKLDWITVRATITFIETEDFCYEVCPNMIEDRQCGVMVTNYRYGRWECDKCDQLFDECDYSYNLHIKIQDRTGSTWVVASQEIGEEIMGISAIHLYYMKHREQNQKKFYQLVKNVLFTEFVFKLKVNLIISGGDEEGVQSSVVKAEKVNFRTESKYLMDQIAKLNEDDSGSLPHKNEPAANYVNTPRETGSSATQVGSYGN